MIYASAFETKAHVAAFGIPVFRVLTVTTTPARSEAMQHACKTHLPHIRPGLLLFTDWQTVASQSDGLLENVLLDHMGRNVRIGG